MGDAAGLPAEGLSRRRLARLIGDPLNSSLVAGRWMLSDDTEHACFTARALLASGGDPDAFEAALARELRWWVAALPAATGLATLKAGLRLWLGVRPGRAGVRSAGNGPAMRAAIIGVYSRSDQQLRVLSERSARLTHTDPRAFHGALAIALAANMSGTGCHDGRAFIERLAALIGSGDGAPGLLAAVRGAVEHAESGGTTTGFADSIGCARGVSGFIMHTVPVAVHAWLRSPNDLATALRAGIACGGDTDTVAAIIGGIVGASPAADIPSELLDRVRDWPRSVGWIGRLGGAIDGGSGAPPAPMVALVLARNAVFAVIVVTHGLRRLLPPY